MSHSQLIQYDHFLDENDWDIYYWATQSPADSPTSMETAEGSINESKSDPKSTNTTTHTSPSSPASAQETDAWRQGKPSSGEWAQTVGTFKPAYRPVPKRWKNSEILKMLREHVRERRSGGEAAVVDSQGKIDQDLEHVTAKGTGMGRMPEVQIFDQ